MAERKAPARKSKTTAPEPAPLPEAIASEAAGAANLAEPHPIGYVGELPDDTPNEHYTLSGVIAGKPVPEHDK